MNGTSSPFAIPWWRTRLHNKVRAKARVNVREPVPHGGGSWLVVVDVTLSDAASGTCALPACHGIAAIAGNERALYSGEVVSLADGEQWTHEIRFVVDVAGGYDVHVDIDAGVGEMLAQAQTCGGTQKTGERAKKESRAVGESPFRVTIPHDTGAPPDGAQARAGAAHAPRAWCDALDDGARVEGDAGRWLRCDVLPAVRDPAAPMSAAVYRAACEAALPRRWAWLPWRCAWPLRSLAERASDKAGGALWLFVVGSSSVRGRWHAALSALGGSASTLEETWKCWGSLDVTRGRLRVTWRDYRPWWSPSTKVHSGYAQAAAQWFGTLREAMREGDGPSLVLFELWYPQFGDAIAQHARLLGDALLGSRRACITVFKAWQGDPTLGRCRVAAAARARAAELGVCFVDEYAMSRGVVHATEAYNFVGKAGFSYHHHFARADSTGAWQFRGHVEEAALQMLLALAQRREANSTRRLPSWARASEADAMSPVHPAAVAFECSTLPEGFNRFLSPKSLVGTPESGAPNQPRASPPQPNSKHKKSVHVHRL